MGLRHLLASTLAPPLCAACGRHCRPESVLCARCARRLCRRGSAARPWPRRRRQRLVLRRARRGRPRPRRLAQVPPPAASRRVDGGPDRRAGAGGGCSEARSCRCRPRRRARRCAASTPLREIASALAARTGAPLRPCLARSGRGRQVGRRRAERLGRPAADPGRRAGPPQRSAGRRRAHHRRHDLGRGAGPARRRRRADRRRHLRAKTVRHLPRVAVRRSIESDPRRNRCGSRYAGATSRWMTSFGITY